MREKIRLKKKWNEDGVSEILSDIMILAMTTVLFTGVFIFVWSMPAPDEDIYAAFDTSLDLNPSGANINITHTGGETLKGVHTLIYVYLNTNENIRILNTQGSDTDNPEYGITGDENWDPSEKWEYHHSNISSEDNVQISIVDTKTNRLVLSARLQGKGFNSPPIITKRWHDPDPAVNESEVTISARVLDCNGGGDVTSVFLNASSLNAELGDVELEDPDGDCIYETTIVITSGSGEYLLSVIAVDVDNVTDSARMVVNVVEAARPIIEYVTVQPNSVEVNGDLSISTLVIDLNSDLNLSDVTVTFEQKFYDEGGEVDSPLDLDSEIPYGGVFETGGTAPEKEGIYEMTLRATDLEGRVTTKGLEMAVIQDEKGEGNGSFNDSIWAYIGPESLDFKNFYYTTDDPPTNTTEYHLAVYISEDHIGDDCFLHVNIINHYYEDVYIDGNSKIRLLQIGGAASNKDIELVQNGTDFGDPVGTVPDGTWYRIPKSETGDYFHGGEQVSLVFGPFDMNSAKAGDVFGSILVLTGSYGSESVDPEDRYGQTLPFQAILIS